MGSGDRHQNDAGARGMRTPADAELPVAAIDQRGPQPNTRPGTTIVARSGSEHTGRRTISHQPQLVHAVLPRDRLEQARHAPRPQDVRNALLPLRAICRRALRQGDINANPTAGVEIPAVSGRRTRIVTPAEALQLVESVPQSDQALWATAFYAGLRRGELQTLAWGDIDLARSARWRTT
jgi:integrase